MPRDKFRVIVVTNNPEEYPQYAEASKEFPDLVEEIEDECETFVVLIESSRFERGHWPARDFFMMVHIGSFESDDFGL